MKKRVLLLFLEISKKDLDLACGLLYQIGISSLEEKNSRNRILLKAELPEKKIIPKIKKLIKTHPDIFKKMRLGTLTDFTWQTKYQEYLKPFLFLKTPELWIDPRPQPVSFPDLIGESKLKNKTRSPGRAPKAPLWGRRMTKGKINSKVNTLQIEAGLAFGTGAHPTTQLAAQLLTESIRKNSIQEIVDLGCGTGLLGLVASKLTGCKVWGIDNDPVALKVAQENFKKNLCKAYFAESLVPLQKKKLPLIVANILLSTLIELRAPITKHLQKKGLLIVSGLLYRDCEELLKAYKDYTLLKRLNRKGWAALLLQKL